MHVFETNSFLDLSRVGIITKHLSKYDIDKINKTQWSFLEIRIVNENCQMIIIPNHIWKKTITMF